MNKLLLPVLAALPLLIASCATPPPPPPQVYHSTGEINTLVIDAVDADHSHLLLPDISKDAPNDTTLAHARKLGRKANAIVILENYHENQPGDEFRDRGVPWFVSLRNLGYDHIIFLQGNGAANPDGLVTLVKYD